ncbi:MAG: hydrogenase maturation protease [Verrucomicrobiae bacterium]|nr:hydrogenase maturation protease [Verrucomicrobiae bacterium]
MNHETLLLALGNDILADDAVGWLAAREVRDEVKDWVDVVECPGAGLLLMEMMAGYKRVLLVDAMQTGHSPVGTVVELSPADFGKIVAPSPHYAGLPEVFALGKRLDVEMPDEVRILAMEVENAREVREGLSPATSAALPAFTGAVRKILRKWK